MKSALFSIVFGEPFRKLKGVFGHLIRFSTTDSKSLFYKIHYNYIKEQKFKEKIENLKPELLPIYKSPEFGKNSTFGNKY